MSRKPRRPGKRPQPGQKRRKGRTRRPVATDILILSDGTVLAHNLTPGMADVLHKLNPKDETIKARAGRKAKRPTITGPDSKASAQHSQPGDAIRNAPLPTRPAQLR